MDGASDSQPNPSLTHKPDVVNRLNGRQLLKRAYEIAYTGHSDINPMSEAPEIDLALFQYVVTENLMPSRQIKLQQ